MVTNLNSKLLVTVGKILPNAASALIAISIKDYWTGVKFLPKAVFEQNLRQMSVTVLFTTDRFPNEEKPFLIKPGFLKLHLSVDPLSLLLKFRDKQIIFVWYFPQW